MSVRSAQYAIHDLEEAGELIIERGHGRGNTHRYYVAGYGANLAPLLNEEPSRNGTEKVQSLQDEKAQGLHVFPTEKVQTSAEKVQTSAEKVQTSAPYPLIPIRPINADGAENAPSLLAKKDQDARRAELEDYFASKTKLPKPPRGTNKQQKAAAELWWEPLRMLLVLVDWDVGRAKRLVDATLQRMWGGKEPLTVSSPKSIALTAQALFAERARSRDNLGKIHRDADGNIILPNR